MTPKEKAIELLDKYDFVYIANYTSMFEVKNCALIAVDEILKELLDYKFNNDMDDESSINYWNKVKQELDKL